MHGGLKPTNACRRDVAGSMKTEIETCIDPSKVSFRPSRAACLPGLNSQANPYGFASLPNLPRHNFGSPWPPERNAGPGKRTRRSAPNSWNTSRQTTLRQRWREPPPGDRRAHRHRPNRLPQLHEPTSTALKQLGAGLPIRGGTSDLTPKQVDVTRRESCCALEPHPITVQPKVERLALTTA